MYDEIPTVSTHNLKTDYSIFGKLKTVIFGFVIFTAVFIACGLEPVREILFNFRDIFNVSWVNSAVEFLTEGLWFVYIFLITGAVVTLLEKQAFTALEICDEGIKFINAKTGETKYADYGDIHIAYGKFQDSVIIESKKIGIKQKDYGWGEFTQSSVLRTNLVKYGGLR